MSYHIDDLDEFDNTVVFTNDTICILSGINFPDKMFLEYFTLIKDNKYICKISIREPNYIDILDSNDFKVFKLSKKEKDDLMKILKSENNKIWKSILDEKNELLDLDDNNSIRYSYDIPIPDYTQLPN